MKKLVLNRETVRSLNGPEMQQVVGGRINLASNCPVSGTGDSTTLQTMSASCHGCVMLDKKALIVNPAQMIGR